MKTYSLKPKEISRKWYVLDASEAPLGRLSTQAARLLLGKDKVSLSPHIDNGDYVIIINAQSLVATGNKAQGKVYYRHSGFPGGVKKRTLAETVSANPEKAIYHAVRGMLPDNKLRKERLARLKIYADSEHAHQGQNPQPFPIAKGRSK